MIRWYGTVLGAMGFAVVHATAAWGQGAAKAEAPAGSGLLSLFFLFVPVILLFIILFPMVRRAKQQAVKFERAVEISEESLLIARRQAEMQAETNRLLERMIEVLGREPGYWSSHE